MKLFSYSTFLLLINSVILGNIQLDSLIELGREYSYQFEFQKAHQIYKEAILKYPRSPVAKHYLSQNYIWFYLGSKDSSYKFLYKKQSEAALKSAELLYAENGDNAKLNNLLGQIYLLQSMMFATEGNSMDAFWSIKSSFSYFEDAINLYENYYDPYLGIGTIKYALSFVPGFLGWAISITGLSGDKREGLRLIKQAYDKGTDSKTEASYHLSKIYTEYNAEYDSAKIYLENLIHNYPNNILFLYQYSILLIETKELNRANELLVKIINLESAEFSQTTSFASFLIGEIAFKQNEFNKAILFYNQFLQSSRSIDYTGLAHLKIGLSNVMLKNDLIAKKYFILARNGNLDIAEDINAKDDSYLFYSKKFTDNDKNMILAQNYFENGKYEESLNTIAKVKFSDLNFNSRAKSRITEAKSHLSLGEIEKAKFVLEGFPNIKSVTSNFDIAEYFLIFAQIKYVEKDYNKSQKYLNSAFEYCDESNSKLKRHLINLETKLHTKNIQ